MIKIQISCWVLIADVPIKVGRCIILTVDLFSIQNINKYKAQLNLNLYPIVFFNRGLLDLLWAKRVTVILLHDKRVSEWDLNIKLYGDFFLRFTWVEWLLCICVVIQAMTSICCCFYWSIGFGGFPMILVKCVIVFL